MSNILKSIFGFAKEEEENTEICYLTKPLPMESETQEPRYTHQTFLEYELDPKSFKHRASNEIKDRVLTEAKDLPEEPETIAHPNNASEIKEFHYEDPEQKVIETDYWSYAPGLINSSCFEELLPVFLEKCKTYYQTLYGKTFPVAKISCAYYDRKSQPENVDAKSRGFSYKNIPSYDLDLAPAMLLDIKDVVEDFFKCETDFVLVHIYRNGDDYIGWHNDKEAIDGDVISVSLGATRKFNVRRSDEEKGNGQEFTLRNGDVFYMHGPRGTQPSFQRMFKHTLPKMKGIDLRNHLEEKGISITGRASISTLKKLAEDNGVNPVRINLTFRQS